MHRVILHHPGLPSDDCQLRPTHIRLVFAEMARGTGFGSELGFAVRASAFADACETVRERYRCRDVRKEFNRAIRLSRRIEAEMGHTPWLRLRCDDRDLMSELLGLQSAGLAA